ncbi:MAG TPA: CsgG/HfaB family protein [Desulfatiglandales bacterium]|nr:CsgG/HfaB family protein [Desulfatiglandales bacterium]
MKHKGLLFVISFSLVLVLGCVAGQESYKMGQELSGQGRLDDAIVFYEKAVRENPKNKDYAQALAQARQDLALVHYRTCKELLEANPSPSYPELTRIFKEISRAHVLDQENVEIANLFNELAKRKQDLLATTQALYKEADTHLKNQEWRDAISKLRKVNKLLPGYEETEDKLARAEGIAVEILYKQGVELSENEDWRMAVQAFKAVVDIDPDYFDVQKLYRKAQANNNADYFINMGERAVQKGEWVQAVLLHERALEYEPDNQGLAKRIEALKLKGGEVCFDRAMELASQRKLSGAAEALSRSLEFAPSLEKSDYYTEFLSSLCQKLDQRSDVYIELKKWGNALVWLKKLENINPEYKGLFHKQQSVRDKIKKRIRKSIAVFDFSSPAENEDAGKIVASKLVSFLSKNASGDLKIVERENLQSILKEMQLGQTGLVDLDTAKTVGKIGGIDTFILGDVLHFSSKSTNYPSKNTVRVQVDSRLEENPAFKEWQFLHPDPSQDEKRTAPPMMIEKPVYEFYTYETGVTKIVSFIEIAYKMVDTLSGENLFTDTIPGKLTKQDDYHHGLPAANIKEDPLELPTEIEVLNELTNQKISEVGLSVLKNFQSLELVYFNEGENQCKRRNFEEAIEGYTDAIFDEDLKGISSPISEKSSEMITKLSQDM